MKTQYGYSLLAIAAGCLLALMIQINSQLAANSSALNASWFAHGIGAVVAWCLYSIINFSNNSWHKQDLPNMKKPPMLFYLGGLPGAFTVILASLTVNSSIGLSGTLALSLVGQITFSMLCEHFALFQLKKQTIIAADLLPVAMVLTGAILLIYTRIM